MRGLHVAVSLLLVAGAVAAIHAVPGGSPDVVLITVEGMRADHVGPCYGYDRETAPSICDLADDAVLFEHAYAQGSWTGTSLAALHTGRSPGVVGLHGFDQRLSRNATTLAERLSRVGYRTRAVTHLAADIGLSQGFDRYRRNGPFTPPDDSPAFTWHFVRQAVHVPLAPASEHRRWDDVPMNRSELAAIPGGVWYDRMQRVGRHEIVALYDAEIRQADARIGTMLDTLKEQGRYSDSLVIVTADHGEILGEGAHWGHTRLRPETIHVPLLVKFPANRFGGTRVTDTVGHTDIVPTVLDIAGIDGSALPGMSLRSVVRDGAAGRIAVAARRPAGPWAAARNTTFYRLDAPDIWCGSSRPVGVVFGPDPAEPLHTRLCEVHAESDERLTVNDSISSAVRDRLADLGYRPGE